MPDPIRLYPKQPVDAPMFNVPGVVLSVIAVLVLVHVGLWVLGPEWRVWSEFALAFNPVRLGGGPPIPYPEGAQYWSFVTYGLLHADMFHLGSNCIWLLIFSTPVARRLGAGRYLLLLIVSAIAGAAAMLIIHWGKSFALVGASASVSAVLAAAIPIMYAPGFRIGAAHHVDYRNLRVLSLPDLFKNSNAMFFGGLFLVMTLVTGASMALQSTAFLNESNIAWEAHLAGFVAGLMLFYLLDKKPFRQA